MTDDKGLPGYSGHLNDRCATMAEVLQPAGYFTALEGQFQAQEQAARLIALLAAVALSLVFMVLYSRYRSVVLALIIMGSITLRMTSTAYYFKYVVNMLWPAGLSPIYPHTMSREPWLMAAKWGIPLLLLLGGVPIFIALMAAALGGIVLSTNPIQAIHSAMYGSLDVFPLLAVPLFIYAGDIMSRGGIARRLIELILSVVGAIRGSLGIATIAACDSTTISSSASSGNSSRACRAGRVKAPVVMRKL